MHSPTSPIKLFAFTIVGFVFLMIFIKFLAARASEQRANSRQSRFDNDDTSTRPFDHSANLSNHTHTDGTQSAADPTPGTHHHQHSTHDSSATTQPDPGPTTQPSDSGTSSSPSSSDN